MAAIGVALALLGPFGSYILPLSARLLFWVGNILAGYAIFRPLLVVGGWLARAAGISATAANLVVLTLGAIPLTFLIMNALARFGDGAARAANFPLVYAQAWGIGLAITLFMNRFFATRRWRRRSLPTVRRRKAQARGPESSTGCRPLLGSGSSVSRWKIIMSAYTATAAVRFC